MQSGYKIKWSDNALSELKATYQYIENNWTEKELRKLSTEIEITINLILKNPNLFQKTEIRNVRKAVVKKFNLLYYRVNEDDTIEILSFFSNRQNPHKLQLK